MEKKTIHQTDPKLIALKFNDRINAQDIDGLVALMTEDHRFIDIPGEVHEGREMMRKGWIDFFKAYPDYINVFSRVENQENLVIMLSHSECSYKPLDGSAIWTALIRDSLVAEWRVYEDTELVRRQLGIR